MAVYSESGMRYDAQPTKAMRDAMAVSRGRPVLAHIFEPSEGGGLLCAPFALSEEVGEMAWREIAPCIVMPDDVEQAFAIYDDERYRIPSVYRGWFRC